MLRNVLNIVRRVFGRGGRTRWAGRRRGLNAASLQWVHVFYKALPHCSISIIYWNTKCQDCQVPTPPSSPSSHFLLSRFCFSVTCTFHAVCITSVASLVSSCRSAALVDVIHPLIADKGSRPKNNMDPPYFASVLNFSTADSYQNDISQIKYVPPSHAHTRFVN